MIELEINTKEEVFDLESLIIDGVDNLIPLSIELPNTGQKAGVYIRPVNTTEFTQAVRGENGVFIEILSQALFNKNKELFQAEAIRRLPAGVAIELYKQIAKISGIPTEADDNISAEMVDQLMGF